MPSHVTIYHSDWGDVKVSDDEAGLLRAYDAIRSGPWRPSPETEAFITKRAEAKLADIERVARWKSERAA